MPKSVLAKTNWVLGEASPRLLGRFDADKPIFKNSAALLENLMIFQSGGVLFRPGTQFVAEVKDSTKKVRLERFRYSISQEYIMEIGDLYIRYYTNGGQLISGGLPVETTTVFALADIFKLQTANKADVMYIVHPSYYPQKLVRTSATVFTISDVPFVRGPFLDDNITATTITPSADTGTNIVLTASTPIFQAGHVKSLWRVKGGVVKITTFTSTTVVNGDVQAEPSGAAGNLGTGPAAVTDWAEGAFSAVRGYPTAITFHEQRLVYAGTLNQPQTFYGSVSGAYDNFSKGSAGASDAYIFTIASNVVNDIRWVDSDVSLKIGTTGGTISATSGSVGISPANPPNITIDTDTGVMATQPQRLAGYLFYLQASKFNLRQLLFDFIINKDKSEDMNILSDHILRDGNGAVQMARQSSPNDRIWIIRGDGQIAVITRNPGQQVTGWFRIVGGESDFTTTCAGYSGHFESVAILPIDGSDDQVWVSCQRSINGAFKRFIEYFTPELFNYYWEPIRMDCSLSLNSPITITGINTVLSPPLVTAPAHGLANGDQIRIDNCVGAATLNGGIFLVSSVTTNTFRIGAVS